jgi:hypothetical protein
VGYYVSSTLSNAGVQGVSVKLEVGGQKLEKIDPMQELIEKPGDTD